MEKPSIAVKKSMRPKRVKIVFSIKCNDLTAHARASIDGSTEISTEDARVLGLMLIALADEEDATATKSATDDRRMQALRRFADTTRAL